MRVLVTRPAAQAQDWVARLAAQGVDAAALPLIAVEPAPDPAAVRAAWQGLAARRLVMFVSPNAVAQFFALQPPDRDWPRALRAASPGPGTGAALRTAGVPAAAILEPPADSPNFDSEALWPVLAAAGPWDGGAVLIVRGSVEGEAVADETGRGREWLARQLVAAGATVDYLVAYRRAAPRFTAEQQAVWQQALAAPAAHLWLLSSSEAVEQLERLAHGGWAAASALATHPRIAARARAAGFGTVLEAAPTLAAVTAAIGSAQGPSIESRST